MKNQTSLQMVDCPRTAHDSTKSSLNTLEPIASQIECPQETFSVLIVDDNDINLKVSMKDFYNSFGP